MEEKIDLIPTVLMCEDCFLVHEKGLSAFIEKYRKEGSDWAGVVPPAIEKKMIQADIGRFLKIKKDKNIMACSFCSQESFKMAQYEGQTVNTIDLMENEVFRSFIERKNKAVKP